LNIDAEVKIVLRNTGSALLSLPHASTCLPLNGAFGERMPHGHVTCFANWRDKKLIEKVSGSVFALD
jgi:hypothetical protein